MERLKRRRAAIAASKQQLEEALQVWGTTEAKFEAIEPLEKAIEFANEVDAKELYQLLPLPTAHSTQTV
eukprot:COSAG05_NODE_782_length_7373_cov_4.015122_6_plen_69_part_00